MITQISDGRIVANELIPVYETDRGERVVDGRELHTFLEVNTRFNDWITRQISNYGFVEGEDFYSLLSKTSEGGRPRTDYVLRLGTAKELAMVENNDQGRRARKYFIAIEERVQNLMDVPSYAIEDPVQRAQRWIAEQRQKQEAEQQVKMLEERAEADRPKVVFAEAVASSRTSILVGDMARILKQNGIDIGQNRFFDWLRENGYLIARMGASRNMPTQYSMDLGIFEIKETVISTGGGETDVRKTPKITGKGQIYFMKKFKEGK